MKSREIFNHQNHHNTMEKKKLGRPKKDTNTQVVKETKQAEKSKAKTTKSNKGSKKSEPKKRGRPRIHGELSIAEIKKMTPVSKRTLQQKLDDFIKCLFKTRGIVSKAAEMANVDRSWVYEEMRKNPEFFARVRETESALCDFIEDKLIELVDEKNPQVVIFAAKTKLKKRGYNDAQQLDITVSQKEFNFTIRGLEEDEVKKIEDSQQFFIEGNITEE